MNKTVFVSKISFDDAARQAQRNGYTITGSARNRRGEFVVFGRKDNVRKWRI